jgi:hypothetical protein
MLDRYDVLQLSPQDFPIDDLTTEHDDLTGTIVVADKPIALFGGHEGALVPTDAAAASDHIEEQILPYGYWGTTAVLAGLDARFTESGDQNDADPHYWTIIAGAPDMVVEFDPEPDFGEVIAFDEEGEVRQFPIAAGENYYVRGRFTETDEPAPFLAVQFMTGAESVASATAGDPLMVAVPATEQFIDRYAFVTDEGYWYDYIIVTRRAGTSVTLECMGGEIPDSYFEQVGGTEWEVARVYIDGSGAGIGESGCGPGSHLLTADQPVGLTVIGYAEYNSYGYPGGFCLAPINDEEIYVE